MTLTNYNPDVLSCLANLSNDEVFTSPSLANNMLDLLPTELWSNSGATFLDPVCKTGVFLREIAKRLDKGLELEIPNRQRRINHILTKQLYGIGITELTSLLSRRSLYGSKVANSEYSFCETFQNEQGNVQFERMLHSWQNGKCLYCGASQEVYDREEILETFAYNFIHTDNPEKLFNMKFDVIVGNPPYQLSDGGAQKSASPIYNNFVEQAIKLNPQYLSMIIPARWYAGGKGLDEFRERMLKDKRLSQIHDYPDTSDCFPGINIRGGVCYFLWDQNHDGDCLVTTHKGGQITSIVARPLLEKQSEAFIRYNEAIPVLQKVRKFNEKSFSQFVSSHKAFGLRTYVKGAAKEFKNSVKLYQNGGIGFINKSEVVKNAQWIDEWKVIVPYASPGSDDYPHLVLSKPIISEPNSCSTETYLVVGPFASKKICDSVATYMCTKFARFLILLLKPSQHVTQKTYALVPTQNFNEIWTDQKLFEKYSITEDEIEFIDTLVKPIEANYE
jgi:site-specific DNA-methyltransferase (adenine-specific)